MIPKRLKIKGLYSYQTEQEIDFDPLTDASLFGIFGAVGSGKSSILEAITFALYGDTERLNKSGDDRTYNMMNLRSDDLLIDFECIAGKNGERYRFTVRGKRNSKNFKDVKTFERKGYVWQENDWVPLAESESTESIIGLSYDNFRRTIIIPQGRFQEFIELKDAERTRMMKELFQLEKYDLSRNVGSLSKQNDLALSNVDGQLLGLGEVTKEMLAEGEQQLKYLRLQIQQISNELVVQTELESKFQKLKLAAEKIRMLQSRLATLDAQRAAMQEREATLKTFETCSLHFKSIFDQKSKLLTDIARDERISADNHTRLAELTTSLSRQQEILQILKPRYEKRDELLATAEEFEKIIRIIEHSQAVTKRKDALIRGEEQLKEKENAIEIQKQQKQELETANEQRKAGLGDVLEMGLVKSWFVKVDDLAADRQVIKAEAEALAAEIKTLSDGLAQRLREITGDFGIQFGEEHSLEGFQKGIGAYLEGGESGRKELNRQLLHISTRVALHQYAGNLEDGEPCPLCGSLHHPEVLTADGALSAQIAAIEKQLNALDEKERLLRRLQSPIERVFNQIESLEKQKGSIKQRYTEAQGRLKAHDEAFIWPAFNKTDRESFEKRFAESSRLQFEIKTGEATLKALAEQIEAAIKEKTERIEKPLQVLRDEILRFENTVQTLSEQLSRVNLADFETVEKTTITEKIAALKTEYQQLSSAFTEAEKQVDALEKEQNTLSGSQATLLAALEGSRRELVIVQERIDSELAAYAFESEAQVAEILQKPIRIDTERKAIDEFKMALETTGAELKTLLEDHVGEQYDAAKHEEVTALKNTLTENLNAQRKEEGNIGGRLKQMAEDLAKKATLLTEKGRLQLRKEHLDDLAKLFRSSGFVDYASSIYLQNLIQAANHRFHQMTHQQLHLELGEGNSFWVRDLLNGGHMRLLKTLSGGQKFQAALSLALALADHIHVRNESKHNFFFLDEGFGSLDKNALQTVFETLKSLRKENRIVGIISHVEDLQQEIQTYLRITESEEGSRIVPSWK
ncbi:exonuclease SbcC [Dyadobacter sp. BE34]|uniref:Exonuclease SbcC n=1 Tax=Dyadobacter fermentans TaxID=94254 RepID=A0ABU1R2I4_9BACT|nr:MULTISPECIES: SMC family ATPase [Dyadobacter]MDR6807598.1 exonuclease SbcC [Dyadobacter fermentans]MDR7045339.1 exonuclease SbcC [Dyadobacter sp. BE242]MDR7199652.1 exonuclease SbcC [Dyadobacter sp. BE34]MDR7217889.1 exonuclease SbcC [Dyadobacter sp. BE31]MDR7265543.1 exonuclease SbcC [Dyadobacter sp. BE32]